VPAARYFILVIRGFMSSLISKPTDPADVDPADVVETTPTPGAAAPVLNGDHRGVLRWGLLLLVLGMGGFFAWAALAPLDQGVPVSGTVLVSSHRKTVQPLQGGLISKILVKEGDVVRAGQPVIELDATRAQSDLQIARGQLLVARASEARLLAEQRGDTQLQLPDEILARRDDPRVAQVIDLQQQLFRSRRANLEAEINAMRASIGGLKAQIDALSETVAARERQKAMLEQELEGQRELTEQGFFARNRLSEQERLLAQLQAQLAEDRGGIARARKQMAEIELRIAQRQQEYQKEVETQLADVQREANGLDDRIRALAFEVRNAVLHAPVGGTIVGLNVFTDGGVVQAGERLMDVVPADEPLRVDAQIPPGLIDRVHTGLPVDLMFTTFNASVTPRIPGVVTLVGADVLLDQDKQPFYRAQVEVTEEGMHLLGQNRILPGMQVMVFVRTGERTLLNYLFKPLRDRMQSALTER
jgi:protease secretion system membrane fusion protein